MASALQSGSGEASHEAITKQEGVTMSIDRSKVFSLFALALLLSAPFAKAATVEAPADEAVVTDAAEADAVDSDIQELESDADLADAPVIMPYPPHPHHGRRVVCSAQNRRGRIFQATGPRRREYEVQQRALDMCYRAHSRHCISLGCQIAY